MRSLKRTLTDSPLTLRPPSLRETSRSFDRAGGEPAQPGAPAVGGAHRRHSEPCCQGAAAAAAAAASRKLEEAQAESEIVTRHLVKTIIGRVNPDALERQPTAKTMGAALTHSVPSSAVASPDERSRRSSEATAPPASAPSSPLTRPVHAAPAIGASPLAPSTCQSMPVTRGGDSPELHALPTAAGQDEISSWREAHAELVEEECLTPSEPPPPVAVGETSPDLRPQAGVELGEIGAEFAEEFADGQVGREASVTRTYEAEQQQTAVRKVCIARAPAEISHGSSRTFRIWQVLELKLTDHGGLGFFDRMDRIRRGHTRQSRASFAGAPTHASEIARCVGLPVTILPQPTGAQASSGGVVRAWTTQ